MAAPGWEKHGGGGDHVILGLSKGGSCVLINHTGARVNIIFMLLEEGVKYFSKVITFGSRTPLNGNNEQSHN